MAFEMYFCEINEVFGGILYQYLSQLCWLQYSITTSYLKLAMNIFKIKIQLISSNKLTRYFSNEYFLCIFFHSNSNKNLLGIHYSRYCGR